MTMVPASLGLGDRGAVLVRFESPRPLTAGVVGQKDFSVSSPVLAVDGDARLSRQDDGAYLLEIPVRVPRFADKRNDQPFNVVANVEGVPVIGSGSVFVEVTLLGFILVAAILAAAALLTPCVYPMIPITVSFFTKQAETSKVSPMIMGLVYCAGIVVSFTLIGALVTLATGTGQAASNFAQSWWMQAAIAVLFITFALSLFGLFEMQLPESVMSLVGRAQGQGGVGGILALGFLFSITTFTCTAAFVGTILAEAASTGNWLYPLVGMVTFATVLALPFFWLSIFPSKVKSLPKSGGWLNQVKVCMGFIELAAAFKFLGGMDMALGWDFFTRPLVIAVWIATFAAMGLYLLGLFRLPHDSPPGKIGVGALMSGLLSLTFAVYLFGGLSGDPLAEGVDAYLPREAEHRTPEGRRQALLATLRKADLGGGGAAPSLAQSGRRGLHDRFEDAYEDARAEAKRLSAALFINFTGHG